MQETCGLESDCSTEAQQCTKPPGRGEGQEGHSGKGHEQDREGPWGLQGPEGAEGSMKKESGVTGLRGHLAWRGHRVSTGKKVCMGHTWGGLLHPRPH